MDQEIWKDIVGYEGLYQVSNLGRVKSLGRYINHKIRIVYKHETILKKNYNRQNYVYVKLAKDGKQKGFLIHRLVAQAFIPNPENKPTINHKNGIHDDNNVINLEWNTYLENNVHAYKIGLKTQRRRRKPFFQIKDGNIIRRFEYIRQVNEQLGYNATNVWAALNGKTKTSHGYEWKYE